MKQYVCSDHEVYDPDSNQADRGMDKIVYLKADVDAALAAKDEAHRELELRFKMECETHERSVAELDAATARAEQAEAFIQEFPAGAVETLKRWYAMKQQRDRLAGIVKRYLTSPSDYEGDAIEGVSKGVPVLLTPKQWLDNDAQAALRETQP